MELPTWDDLSYPQRFFFSLGVASVSDDDSVHPADLYEKIRAGVNGDLESQKTRSL